MIRSGRDGAPRENQSRHTWHFRLPVATFDVRWYERGAMTSGYRSTRVSVMLSVVLFAWAPCPALSETPGEIPKPWTYEGSMKLQEQQRQPDQPLQQPGTRQNGGGGAAGGPGGA